MGLPYQQNVRGNFPGMWGRITMHNVPDVMTSHGSEDIPLGTSGATSMTKLSSNHRDLPPHQNITVQRPWNDDVISIWCHHIRDVMWWNTWGWKSQARACEIGEAPLGPRDWHLYKEHSMWKDTLDLYSSEPQRTHSFPRFLFPYTHSLPMLSRWNSFREFTMCSLQAPATRVCVFCFAIW